MRMKERASLFERGESQGRSPRLIPARDQGPTCNKAVCSLREINVKIYIEDRLWEAFDKIVGRENIKGNLEKQVGAMIAKANRKHLRRLDNGGYKIDNDRTKPFNPRRENQLLNWALAFQQTVYKMPTL